ncbi:transporter [Priestia megaterium]|uniref:transporter n=1 Tax=Priestia megaterium TaxID=1404 RepID=UPI002452E6B7|nr:transporter [Priestia megaterium]MDH3161253.1 transporter [Priestia megaterium]MED4116620.1 transporter [Priestia megaterium]
MDVDYIDSYSYPRFLGPQFPFPSPPRPPGGFPGAPGGFPGSPGGFPSFGGQQPPTTPPPAFIPQQQLATPFAVDPGAISMCLFRNTFIWLRNGSSFWFFPIFVGPRSVAGFRWNGRFWTIFGIDTRRIVSFTCF